MKKFIYILLIAIMAGLTVISIKYLKTNKQTLDTEILVLSDPNKPTLKIRFANFWPNVKLFDFGIEMISEILSEEYNLKIVQGKDCDVVIEGILKRKKQGVDLVNYGSAVKIFYTWEAVKPDISLYDLALGFNFIDSPNYIRLPLFYSIYRDKVSESYKREKCEPSKKKNFACFLVTNGGDNEPKKFDGCVARNRMFHRLSLYKKVLSGGPYLNNTGSSVPHSETMQWLNNCKFTIAYENETFDGYMTEKVFQAYYGGTIPIYYGAANSLENINKNAIIYAGDFATEEELTEYIQKVDQDDELYCKIWNEKIITDKSKDYATLKEKVKTKLKQILYDKLRK